MWAAEAILKRKLHLSKTYARLEDITTIPKGTKITITKGREQKYCLWHSLGLWDIDEMYIDEESIVILSPN
jgi:hypothetical protein